MTEPERPPNLPGAEMKTLVIGLGNPILTDDGVGHRVVREVEKRIEELGLQHEVSTVLIEAGGFGLLELLAGHERVILVDAVCFDGVEPGRVVEIEPGDLRTSLRIRSVHEIDLPSVLCLGRSLGFKMPLKLRVFGIQACDAQTFGESLTPAVEEAARATVAHILQDLASEYVPVANFC